MSDRNTNSEQSSGGGLALSVTTGPTEEPITLDDAKAHLRVDNDDAGENAWITTAIQAAREQVENDTRRALFTQTLRLNLDQFPMSNAILIPRPPLQSVASITYVDSDGATQTMSSSDYIVDTASEPGRVVLAYGKTWPTAREQANSVAVNFVAGWTAGTMPAAVKQLMYLWVGHWHENREAVNVGNITSAYPLAIDSLTARLRFGDYR